MTKTELRKFIKNQKSLFLNNDSYRIQTSYDICKKICNTQEFKNSSVVFAFIPMDDEVNIGGVIVESFLQNKKVAVPLITDKDGLMEFHWITPESPMKKNPLNIFEPYASSDTLVNMKEIKSKILLITPGLAFSENGKRLGRGKGFYDRFLNQYKEKVYKLGTAFPFQILQDVPVSENDIPVDSVIA